jgi:purine nucleosidase
MVGLDVTREMVLAPNEITRLAHSSAANARWIEGAVRFYMEFHKRQEGLDGCVVNDLLPIAALVKPGVLTFEERQLRVDMEDGEHRGHTHVDPAGTRVLVATQVDVAKVRSLLSERVFRWATRSGPAPGVVEGEEAHA